MGGPGSGRKKGDVSLTPPFERFWARVDTSGECWIWTGARTRGGYGTFHDATGGSVIASRAAFEMANGKIAAGMSVLHACDNPPCVRPSHLFLGTLQDNIADAVAKGRMNYGERNAWTTMPERMHNRRSNAPLDSRIVEAIRASYAAGETQGAIARRYGITTSGVSRIVRGLRRAA